MTRRLFPFILVLAFLVCLPNIVQAVDPVEYNVIYGCVDESKEGALRVVSDISECVKKEIPVAWSIMGPMPRHIWDGTSLQFENPDGTFEDPLNLLGPVGPAGPAGADADLNELCESYSNGNLVGCPNFCTCEKKVFLTSQTYDGNLGGLDGGDAKCQHVADAAGLPGVFKAWLSSSIISASDRFVKSDRNVYVLVDGTPIANSWSDLTDGTLLHAINMYEDGNVQPPGGGEAYTGTYHDGSIAPYYGKCHDWTNNDDSIEWDETSVGLTNYLEHDGTGCWSDYGSIAPGCSKPHPLYCFQQ